jgi:hypothetical protein
MEPASRSDFLTAGRLCTPSVGSLSMQPGQRWAFGDPVPPGDLAGSGAASGGRCAGLSPGVRTRAA